MTAFIGIWKKASFLMILLSGLAGISAFIVLFQLWLFTMLPGNAARGVKRLEIVPGTNTAAVSELLYANGIVSDAKLFYLVSRIRGVGHRLQAGEYDFLSPSSPLQILDQMVRGRVVLHRVTFPEGATIRDIARIIEREGLASGADIIRLSHDKSYIASLGVRSSSLEGYLFPETYSFRKEENGLPILKAMVQQFWKHVPSHWMKRADELGMSFHEIVTLASIVEKEAVVDSERPLIASVFFNRLKKKMPLESDPTAVYDIADFTGPITPAHLKRQSSYNTYQMKGLPAGPICNPGAKSIEAVLYPAENVSYLYFVSNNDGTHQFSDTLAEHSRAVLRYREARKAAQEKSEESPADPVVDIKSPDSGPGNVESLNR